MPLFLWAGQWSECLCFIDSCEQLLDADSISYIWTVECILLKVEQRSALKARQVFDLPTSSTDVSTLLHLIWLVGFHP